MSDDDWRDRCSRYESRALYASADALDNTPLLTEDAYSVIPVRGDNGSAAGTTDLAIDWPWHCHWPQAVEPPSAVPQLTAAIVMCAVFMVCELIGGYLAGSLAVMCDAAHLLSDCGGFGLALMAVYLAARPNDCRMSYGYRRAEVLGAMASVLLIWILTAVFVYMACVRLYTGDYEIEPDTMMVVSGVGVVINVAIALLLHGCCSNVAHHHSHGHQHSHSHTDGDSDHSRHRAKPRYERDRQSNGSLLNGDITIKEVATATPTEALPGEATDVYGTGTHKKTDKNINLRAALIHVIGDLIQSCGVFIAALIIKFFPTWKVMDPICTFIFGILVLMTTNRVVRDALTVLMQAVPSHFQYKECLWALQRVSGVRTVHSFHAWGLSTHHTVVTGHVVVDDFSDQEAVLQECVDIVRRYGGDSVTLQVERYHVAMATCRKCSSQPGAQA